MNVRGCYSTLRSVKIIVRDLPCRDPRERGGGGGTTFNSSTDSYPFIFLKARNKVQRHVVERHVSFETKDKDRVILYLGAMILHTAHRL